MMRQGPTDVRGGVHTSATSVGHFNTPPSVTGQQSRQIIRIDSENLNSMICQLDLPDFYRFLHPKTAHSPQPLELTRNVQKRDQIWGHAFEI